MMLKQAVEEALAAHNGAMTPGQMCEYARARPDGPLHAYVFNRDQVQAAEGYYLERCRMLFRTFRIRYAEPTETEGPRYLRAYHSVPGDVGREYRAIEAVAMDEFTTRLLLQQMERDINALRRKYGHLQEFIEQVRSLAESLEAAS